MAKVALENLIKKYGNTQVIHSINVQIQDGEFIVIVGPSGCGKSTVLRMIAGLEQVTAGKVFIGDACMNKVEPKDRNIAMVFQNYALYPHMTVFNNMAYGLKLRKMSGKDIAQRVEEAADLLQLDELLNRKPKQLSGGQRQRVAMGRAIVRHPSVFLFDEPLSNLDAKLRQTMRVELKKIHATLKTTMIYVTHDQIEAMTLADKIIVMKDGIIEQVGTPGELYTHPETLFAAKFIGSPEMNLFKADVRDTAIGFKTSIGIDDRFKLNGNTVSMPVGSCLCGVRPEHLTILSETEKTDVVFSARIDFVENLGSDTLYYLAIPGADSQLIIKTGDKSGLSPGQTINAGFSWENCHFFNPDTQTRIKPVNQTDTP